MAGSPTPPDRAAPDAFAARLTERAGMRDADPVRERTRALLAQRGLPSGRKLETWKYTDLRAFYAAQLLDAEPSCEPGLAVRARGSAGTPAGVVISRTADRPARLPAAANAGLDLDRYPLAIVNTLLVDDWIAIDVAAGVDAGTLEIEDDARTAAHCQRLLVRLGAGSRLHVLESPSSAAANRVVEIDVGVGAHLVHDRLEAGADAPHWSLVSIDVAERGRYSAGLSAFSAAPRRSDLHVKLRGRAAHAELLGALGSAATGQLDVQVVVEHFGAATISKQKFHGLAAQRGQLTFNGRIEIHPGADGADARLDNRNLLLASTARVNAKPELEIHTRDVRCGHGATVGRLDPEQVFYLRSRGIGAEGARALLTRAFVAQCLSPEALARGVDARFAELAR